MNFQSPNALSPITAKKALEKNLKKVEQLKEQLQIEINEKNELAEENSKLQHSVDNLSEQLLYVLEVFIKYVTYSYFSKYRFR